jgi:uncharacterized damage-inducible protein DinB
MASYEGGCHCGAVRFKLELDDDPRDVLECNCSICAKKGFLHLIVPEAALQFSGTPSTYTFGTHVAHHMFCPTCGIHAFYRPRSHPDAWDVNVRCLDRVPISHWRIKPFDGEHWEAASAEHFAPAEPSSRELMERMAHNNTWANHRLHAAVAQLSDEDYRATRTSFFPSIHLTLSHILFVDLWYVASLEGRPKSRVHWAENDRFDDTGTFAEVRARQREVDLRLIAASSSLGGVVEIVRTAGIVVEPRALVLLHLFEHQIHHRGQVHAMLAGTAVPPPQLDDFFLTNDLPLRASELRELGLPER